MKAEFMNPFIKASTDIIKQAANIDCNMGKILIKESSFQAGDVNILIGLTGDLRGRAVIGMSREIAKKIASNMMCGMPVEHLDEMAKSAISELGNMILGNASTILYDSGFEIDITPPTLLIGEKLSISTADVDQTVTVPLNMDMGVIELDISVKEKE